jgi:hypothetical protein
MMNKIKASELPVGTTIEATDKDKLGWERVGEDHWGPTAYHCLDCYDDDMIHNEEIDEKVPDFKIVTMPYSVVESLADDVLGFLQHEWHSEETVEDIVKQAIEKAAKDI